MNIQILNNLWMNPDHPWFKNKEIEQALGSIHSGIQTAIEAEHHWVQTIKHKQATENTPEFKLEQALSVLDILIQSKMVESRSEARRLLKDGAIKLNGDKIFEETFEINTEGTLQIGKRRLLKLVS